MHTSPNKSRSKDNQAIKFSQLIEYNMKSHAETEARRLAPDLFFI